MQMFERDVPGENKSGLSGQSISHLPLETCQTMNGMWGYKIKDQNYKSATELLRLLVRTASKGANLLLNVGPQPNGELPAMALSRLSEMGQWLNGKAAESIYSTEAPQTSVTLPLHKVKAATSLLSSKALKMSKDRKAGTVSISIPDMKAGEADYILKLSK